jgi:hypothetical protein
MTKYRRNESEDIKIIIYEKITAEAEYFVYLAENLLLRVGNTASGYHNENRTNKSFGIHHTDATINILLFIQAIHSD